MKTKLSLILVIFLIAALTSAAQSWGITGNSGTNTSTNFLGTTDKKGLVLRTNNIERLRITKDGNVGIDQLNPQQKLDVNGNINIPSSSGFYIGNERMIYAPTGNFFAGLNAGFHTSSLENVGVGNYALLANTTGSTNTALGDAALFFNTIGNYNSAAGGSSLFSNTTGDFNSAFGFAALNNNTTGGINTATGARALASNTTGEANTANGADALFYNSTANFNTASGYQAMYSNTIGENNNAFGDYALYSNYNGLYNTASGSHALYSNTSGTGNVAYGPYTLYSATANDNSAVGNSALRFNTTGYENTACGVASLYSNVTGFNNIGIGDFVDVNAGNLKNSTGIGSYALITAKNQVRIGNSDVTSIGGYTNWTNISDGRVKKNIKENVPGLSFINKLKPITYNLNLDAADKLIQRPVIKNNDGKNIQPAQKDLEARKAKEQIVYTGFIAQDVEKAAKKLNYDFSGVDVAKNSKDLYGLRYAEFVVPLVKAVQELSVKNEELEKRIEKLEALLSIQSSNTLSALSENSNGDLSAFSVKISPNPFQSVLNIQFANAGTLKNTINIYDVNGKLFLTKSAKGNTQIDLKQLTAGTYLIKINDESGKVLYNGKVIKQ